MILDGENMFFNGHELSAATLTSDVIHVGEGEAGDPLFLVVSVKGGNSGGALSSVVLETSATADFADAVTLGTFTTPPVHAPIPRGNLGYLRLKAVSTYTAGTVTAGLALDDDVL